MIEYLEKSVRVTADDGTTREFSLASFAADAAACIASTGKGIKTPVPESITRGQAKIALHAAGLLAQIEAIIAAGETPAAIKIAWAEEPRFYRESPAINTLAATIGLTSEQLDDLFRSASQVMV